MKVYHIQAYRFTGDNSDKFWTISCQDCAYAVNYGKTGTIGKYQVKEFDNPEKCEKEAQRLIASKLKKGYLPYPEFDPETRAYFDDSQIGLHPLTSHPRFRESFGDGFYFDCGEEEAPFGSDGGSDTLHLVEELFRKSKEFDLFDFAAFPKKLIETYWGMEYLPADDLSREAVEKVCKSDEMNRSQSDQVTVATAFAQIKISGRLDGNLKRLALNALRRTEMAAEILGWNTAGHPSEITAKLIADLEAFPAG